MGAPEPAQYDSFADAYREHAEVAPWNALYDRPATLALLGDVAGKRVLDAACGPGIYAEELLARGADVVGFDASAAMVELARARTGGRAELRVHSMEEPLPWLDDASVDVVLSALAHHYVTDRVGFLREAHRVLRPGGAAVISTHHPAADWVRLGGPYFEARPVTEVWSKGWEITAWQVPLSQLTEEFAAAGFVIERLVEPRPQPEMAASHPDAHERLSTGPGFILFRLRPS
ncbi:MAG TPA: class I SAM-dependent methyltransferase [Acidimicrobiales bacterium]|nr:class I SAM-dependent methyltransferase [Acidimicrobiales bacterium]